MTSRLTVAITSAMAALLFVAGCGSSASPLDRSAGGSPAASAALSSSRCADLVVLGVRGSGQAAGLNRGVGQEVLRTVTDLARLVDDRTGASVRLEAVPYDASGTATSAAYFQHVEAGVRLARRQAAAVLDRCPRTRLAVVGFSQGANVVHDLVDDLDDGIARRTVLAAMIADPQRDPDDAIRHWSYGDPPLTGTGLLGPGRPVAAEVRAAAISLCTAGDEVCNTEPGRGVIGGRTSPTHRHFYERPATAQETARQLDDVLAANDA